HRGYIDRGSDRGHARKGTPAQESRATRCTGGLDSLRPGTCPTVSGAAVAPRPRRTRACLDHASCDRGRLVNGDPVRGAGGILFSLYRRSGRALARTGTGLLPLCGLAAPVALERGGSTATCLLEGVSPWRRARFRH